MAQLTTESDRMTSPLFKKSHFLSTYKIHLESAEEGGFVVTSPDFPELVTQGDDENEATNNAYEAVGLILEEDGREREFTLVIDER
jgi:predicted RNase H-like HicB family nuclease